MDAWMLHSKEPTHQRGTKEKNNVYYVVWTNQIATDVMQQWACWSLVSVSDLPTHFWNKYLLIFKSSFRRVWCAWFWKVDVALSNLLPAWWPPLYCLCNVLLLFW